MTLICRLDFSLTQIIPLSDDLEVIAASFVDTFILLVGRDGRLSIFRADDSGDLEELQIEGSLTSERWQSGTLYDDVNNTFQMGHGDEEEEQTSVLMFLLSADGGLQVQSSFQSNANLLTLIRRYSAYQVSRHLYM